MRITQNKTKDIKKGRNPNLPHRVIKRIKSDQVRENGLPHSRHAIIMASLKSRLFGLLIIITLWGL